MRKHIFIPDAQVTPDTPTEHLDWIGRYIVEQQPDVIINIGDFADMESLSSYDAGKRDFEGRRYINDVDAARKAMDVLMSPINSYNARKKENHHKQYKPELHLTLGNHEDRISRAINNDAKLDGTMGLMDLGYEEWGWEVHDFLRPVCLDGVNYCLASHHKVLTRDLRYVPLKDLRAGDELLAFDEYSTEPRCGRRFKTSVVEALGNDERSLFEVELTNGKKFEVTEDHLWLARKYGSTSWEWIRTDELIIGKSEACHVMPEWEELTSYNAGWLAGMFDGEGYIVKPNCKQGGIQVGIAQRFGRIQDLIAERLDEVGASHKVASIGGSNNDVAQTRILGPSGEKIGLLGKIRAERLIQKFRPEMLGRVQKMDHGDRSVVKGIRPIGLGEVTKIRTSTRTLICEGYAHHNCHYFANPLSGRPWGGQSIDTRLKNIGFSFSMGHQQVKMVGERFLNNGQRIRGLVAGSCLTPDHKVLTADLRYVPLGEVKAGDKLVSFDENPKDSRKRAYRTGTVEKVKLDKAPCFRVTLDNGKHFDVTDDHYWLTRVGGQKAQENGSSYMWRQTSELRVGSVIPRLLEEWEESDSRDAGYLRGMYDGEGTLYARPVDSAGGAVMQLSLYQRRGTVLDECHRILNDLVGAIGLNYQDQKGVVGMRVKGGAKACAKMLGIIRPLRLLEKFRPELLGSVHTNTNSKIVSIEPMGDKEIVRIAIDEKTMIVEGYPHHNCYLHDENYMGPQGNAYWRGIFVKHEVTNGQYDLMEVSLDYLCRRYEGVPVWEFMKEQHPEIYEGSTWMRYQGE